MDLHTLSYIPIQFPLFCYLNYSSFGSSEFFQLTPVSLWPIPIIVGFLPSFFFLFCCFEYVFTSWHYKDTPNSSSILPVPGLGPALVQGPLVADTGKWY